MKYLLLLLFFHNYSFSQSENNQDRNIETISGEVKYASMNYWLDIGKGKIVDLSPDEEHESLLNSLIGHKVSFTGSLSFYPDKTSYMKVSKSTIISENKKFSAINSKEYIKQITYGEKIIYEEEDYESVLVKKVFNIYSDKVALIQLNTGGVSCPSQFIFIAAKTDGSFIKTKKFGNCNDEPKVSFSNNKVTVIFSGNPSEKWIYDNNLVNQSN